MEDLSSYTKGLISIADLGLDAEDSTQAAMLRDKPDVIVTTPSRLLNFIKEKLIDLKVCFDSLVVDEAGTCCVLFNINRFLTFFPLPY